MRWWVFSMEELGVNKMVKTHDIEKIRTIMRDEGFNTHGFGKEVNGAV